MYIRLAEFEHVHSLTLYSFTQVHLGPYASPFKYVCLFPKIQFTVESYLLMEANVCGLSTFCWLV